jgi:hypothetical protein
MAGPVIAGWQNEKMSKTLVDIAADTLSPGHQASMT